MISKSRRPGFDSRSRRRATTKRGSNYFFVKRPTVLGLSDMTFKMGGSVSRQALASSRTLTAKAPNAMHTSKFVALLMHLVISVYE